MSAPAEARNSHRHPTRPPDVDCAHCGGRGWRLVSFLAVCSCTRPQRASSKGEAPDSHNVAAAAHQPPDEAVVSAPPPLLSQIAALAEDHILQAHGQWCEDAARRLSAIYKLATGEPTNE